MQSNLWEDPQQSEEDREHGVWKSQKNVSFNITSEVSYVYIFSGQKLIKNAKMVNFGKFLKIF